MRSKADGFNAVESARGAKDGTRVELVGENVDAAVRRKALDNAKSSNDADAQALVDDTPSVPSMLTLRGVCVFVTSGFSEPFVPKTETPSFVSASRISAAELSAEAIPTIRIEPPC
ncbi:MAG TPA: hypothetical protein VIW67_16520 [Terriglobales bacterium]